MGIRRGATERQSEGSAQQGTDHSSNIGEHGAGRLTEEQLKYANIGTNSSSSQDMGAGKPRVLSHVKHSVDVSLQACAAGADSDRVAGLALEKGLRNQLSAMLHVPEDQVSSFSAATLHSNSDHVYMSDGFDTFSDSINLLHIIGVDGCAQNGAPRGAGDRSQGPGLGSCARDTYSR